MASIEVQINDTQVTAALARLAKTGRRLRPAFQDVGERLVVSTKERFQDKRAPGGSPWPANAASTIAAKGRNNPLIGESRRLSGEIHYRAQETLLQVGSPLEYAALQQFGAPAGAFGAMASGALIPWGDVPPRPFLGLSAGDVSEVVQILQEHIRQSWSGTAR